MNYKRLSYLTIGLVWLGLVLFSVNAEATSGTVSPQETATNEVTETFTSPLPASGVSCWGRCLWRSALVPIAAKGDSCQQCYASAVEQCNQVGSVPPVGGRFYPATCQ